MSAGVLDSSEQSDDEMDAIQLHHNGQLTSVMMPVGGRGQEPPTPTLLDRSGSNPREKSNGNEAGMISMESLILAQDERWRRA